MADLGVPVLVTSPLSAAASFDCSGLSLTCCSADLDLPPESSTVTDCLDVELLGVDGFPPFAVFLLLMLTNTVGQILQKVLFRGGFVSQVVQKYLVSTRFT